MKDKDSLILMKIIQYTDEISGTLLRFNLDLTMFKNDYVVKNAIAMCVLQIGELVVNLSDEIKIKHTQMPWRDIVGMRNRVVHTYNNIDTEILWSIATVNIPELKAYCNIILMEMKKE